MAASLVPASAEGPPTRSVVGWQAEAGKAEMGALRQRPLKKNVRITSSGSAAAIEWHSNEHAHQ